MRETRCRKRDRENYFKLVGVGINYLNIVRSIQKIEKKIILFIMSNFDLICKHYHLKMLELAFSQREDSIGRYDFIQHSSKKSKHSQCYYYQDGSLIGSLF